MAGLEIMHPMDPEDQPDDDTLKTLGAEEQVVVLVAWFGHNFEDPAHSTPYESAEGGYQYIWGGPYDAREELQDRFSELEDEVIEEAVSAIEAEAVDWAPNSNRLREDGDEEPPEPVIDQDAWRERVTTQLDELQGALDRALESSRGGIGHNRPPEPIEEVEAPFTQEEASAVQSIIDETRKDIANTNEQPDVAQLRSRSKQLSSIASKILGWIGKRVNAAIDKALPFAGGYMLDHYKQVADKLVYTAHTLADWAMSLPHPPI